MKLDNAIIKIAPRTINLYSVTRSTNPNDYDNTDILAALGILQSRQPLGLGLMLAKYSKDMACKKKSITLLMHYCLEHTPRQIKRKLNKDIKLISFKLCEIVVNDFCRTIDNQFYVCRCGGRGFVNGRVTIKKVNSENKIPTFRSLTHKICSRCNGTGIKRIPSSKVYEAMTSLFEINKNDWTRYWKPFYDELITVCAYHLADAQEEFKRITQ